MTRTGSSSSEEDDNFLRVHAKEIAEALQRREASEQQLQQQQAQPKSAANPSTASKLQQRNKLIHDTYVALCYDDPRVESDAACRSLAAALLDPKSPYALSGPLVEGIRQLCAKQQQQQQQEEKGGTTQNQKSTGTSSESEALTTASSSTPHGAAILAWTVYARIPLLLCQASELSQVHAYLGSYRPPPPSPSLAAEKNSDNPETSMLTSPQKGQDADRLAALLSQPPPDNNDNTQNKDTNITGTSDNNNLHPNEDKNKLEQGQEEEVWAAESDPSDFEFDSGFSYEQQVADFEQSFSEWMIDRSDPMKLSSKPPNNVTTNWKHVRHAVMDLTSQLTYRKVAPLLVRQQQQQQQNSSDILIQFTMTLLIPPPASSSSSQGNNNSSSTRPSIFDSPDEEEDYLQPERQLQNMAWYPLWVLRDAASSSSSSLSCFSRYVTLLQNLISVDAAVKTSPTVAGSSTTTKPASSMVPATYVGLASLSALCQQFVVDASMPNSNNISHDTVERYRALRLSLWETCDDLTHAFEQEDSFRKPVAALAKQKMDASSKDDDNDSNQSGGGGVRKDYWMEWTLLPFFEIITNQRLQDGTTIVTKAESVAQRHHNQQLSQRWAGMLQSGLFRQWLVRLQALKDESEASSNNTCLLYTSPSPRD